MMDCSVKRVQLENGQLDLYSGVFSPTVAAALLKALLAGVTWRQDEIRIAGKSVLIPRKQAWYGDPGVTYTYSGLTLEPRPWSGPVEIIRDKVAELTDYQFNGVLLNWYRDGNDSMGWHSDDEPELGQNPVIASFNLGDTRKFVLRNNSDPDKKHALQLEHNSLLLMSGPMQHHWKHCVPKTAQPVEDRVNLTFRQVKSTPA